MMTVKKNGCHLHKQFNIDGNCNSLVQKHAEITFQKSHDGNKRRSKF